MDSSSRPLAVVTGASTGIGLELAKQFAQNGFDLFVTADEDRLADAVNATEGLGATVQSLMVDLTRPEGVEQLAEAIASTGRPVEAIAFNAGIGAGGGFVRTSDLDQELRLVQLNCASTVHLAKRILPGMAERGAGRVLFTASIASTSPAPYQAVYGASKAFVLSLADSLRHELKDTGVTVTALMPGPTETEFFDRGPGMTDQRVYTDDKADPAQVARQGFEALMKGDDHVIGGPLKTRLQGKANEVLPERAKAAAFSRLTEPGSADD